VREEDRELIEKLESRRLRALCEGRVGDAQRLAEWILTLIFGAPGGE
jgi:hypothetical protein